MQAGNSINGKPISYETFGAPLEGGGCNRTVHLSRLIVLQGLMDQVSITQEEIKVDGHFIVCYVSLNTAAARLMLLLHWVVSSLIGSID